MNRKESLSGGDNDDHEQQPDEDYDDGLVASRTVGTASVPSYVNLAVGDEENKQGDSESEDTKMSELSSAEPSRRKRPEQNSFDFQIIEDSFNTFVDERNLNAAFFLYITLLRGRKIDADLRRQVPAALILTQKEQDSLDSADSASFEGGSAQALFIREMVERQRSKHLCSCCCGVCKDLLAPVLNIYVHSIAQTV